MTVIKPAHALVIGGSGMLSNVSLWLAGQGYITSVIGRNKARLDSLVSEGSNIIPLCVDYHDLPALQRTIDECMNAHGAFNIVVSWIHKPREKVLDVICRQIERASDNSWELYHVSGSSDNAEEIRNRFHPAGKCSYYQIRLGFILEGGQSRWLTNGEISDGVIKSIQGKRNVLVGQLEPWELRPKAAE